MGVSFHEDNNQKRKTRKKGATQASEPGCTTINHLSQLGKEFAKDDDEVDVGPR